MGGPFFAILGLTMKTCTKCSQSLALDDFYKDKSKKDGRTSYCKTCCKAKSKKQDYDPEYHRAYREGNREQINARLSQWRFENLDERLKVEAQYRDRNRDRVRKTQQKYGSSEKGLLTKRRATHKRYSMKRSIGWNLPSDYWEKAIDYYGDCCMRCGANDDLEYDHIIPVSWGIISSYDFMNLQILCGACNVSKGNRSSIDFRPRNKQILGCGEDMTIDLFEMLEVPIAGF